MGRSSTGLSSHNIKEVPGEKEEEGSHGGLWGGPEYITVINGTVPQTHGARKWSRARGLQNTTDSIELQSVPAVNGAVYDAGGGLLV